MTRILLTAVLVLWCSVAGAAVSTYYVDPGALGDSSGTSWTNAFTTVQSGMSSGTANGNVLYLRSSTGTINCPATLTEPATNMVRVIGCNASGVNDGTLLTLASSSSPLLASSQHEWRFDNLAFAQSNTAANVIIDTVAGNGSCTEWFCNMKISGGSCGYVATANSFPIFTGVEFAGQILAGINTHSSNNLAATAIKCTFHGSQYGIYGTQGGSYMACPLAVDCYFYNESVAGIFNTYGVHCIGCTFNNCATSVSNYFGRGTVVDCRISGGSAQTAIGTANNPAGAYVINSYLSAGTIGPIGLNTGIFGIDYKGQSLSYGPSGAVCGLVTGAGPALQISPTASGYWTSTTLPDGAIINSSQGVNSSQDPTKYSTTSSAILAGNYSATGGTLGTLSLLTASASDVWSGITVQSGTGTVTGNLSLATSGCLSTLTLHGTQGTYVPPVQAWYAGSGTAAYGPGGTMAGTAYIPPPAYVVHSLGNYGPGGSGYAPLWIDDQGLNATTVKLGTVFGVSSTGTYSPPPGTTITLSSGTLEAAELNLAGSSSLLSLTGGSGATATYSGTLISAGGLSLVGSNVLTTAGTNSFTIGVNPAQTPSFVPPVQGSVIRPSDGGTAYGPSGVIQGTGTIPPETKVLWGNTYGILGTSATGTFSPARRP